MSSHVYAKRPALSFHHRDDTDDVYDSTIAHSENSVNKVSRRDTMAKVPGTAGRKQIAESVKNFREP